MAMFNTIEKCSSQSAVVLKMFFFFFFFFTCIYRITLSKGTDKHGPSFIVDVAWSVQVAMCVNLMLYSADKWPFVICEGSSKLNCLLYPIHFAVCMTAAKES